MDKIRFLIHKFREILEFLRPMGIPQHSAYTCFFLILSLFPGLLLLLGVLRYTQIRTEDLMALLSGWLPGSLLPTAKALVESSYRHASGVVVSVSVVAALYSSSRGMFGILNGLGAVYGTQRKKGYWRRKAISVVYTGLFLLLLVITLGLHIFGNAILDYLWMTTNPAVMALLQAVDFKGLLLLTLLGGLFAAMYALLSGKRNRLRHSLPGAAAAATLWLLFSRLFSVYVDYFSAYTNIYGSIYALALGMLWLYFCVCIFFYGGALNVWLQKQQTDR